MGEDNASRHNCAVHWIEKDGLRLPKPVGGHPALDFCNTWAGWNGPPDGDPARREWLQSYDELVAWSALVGLVEQPRADRLRAEVAQSPRRGAAVLTRARTLRTAVHDAVLDPTDEDALAGVTLEVRRAGAAVRVVPRSGGGAGWELTDEAGLDLPVLAAAWSAAALLTSPDVATVSACPGVECGWVFLDRRGRRRWCDMATCGNRAKVAAHARRAKAAR